MIPEALFGDMIAMPHYYTGTSRRQRGLASTSGHRALAVFNPH